MPSILTIAFDLALIGTALWLGAAVAIDVVHDRRPRVGGGRAVTLATRRPAKAATSERAATAALVRS